MTWWEGRLACLDLETTHPDPEEARIVTAAFGFVGGGQPTEMTELLVNPGIEIPAEATEVHGITNEMVQADGVHPSEALAEIWMMLYRTVEDGLPLVIFNARYDLTVGDRELRREGLKTLSELDGDLLVVDPLVIDRQLHRYRKGKRTLEAQCEHYLGGLVEKRLDAAHTAGADALAAARLAYWIGKSGRVIRRVRNGRDVLDLQQLEAEWARVRGDLVLLHGAQQVWAYREAVRLEQYFRTGNARKGVEPEPDAVVPRDWPVVPVGWEDSHVPAESAMALLTPEWTT